MAPPSSPRPTRAQVDRALVELGRRLRDDQVVTDPELLPKYGEDYSFAGVHLPDAVVRAESAEDVRHVFQAASAHGVPVTPRGLGSGKSGGALPIHGGLVLALERMSQIKEIDRDDLLAVVEPGLVLGTLMQTLEQDGLFYPPDPNSFAICSIGGNVACNAGGPRALKYGVTRNYVLGLEVVTPTGDRLRVGRRTLKWVTGYDLVGLMVGSEGTLGVITEVTLKVIAKPAELATALVSFSSLEAASRAVSKLLRTGIVPRTLEFLDDRALAAVRAKTPGRFPANAEALFILETDGSTPGAAEAELARAAEVMLDAGAIDVLVAQDSLQRERIWEPRRVLSMTLAETAPKKISEDVVVPRTQIPALLVGVRAIGERHRIRTATYGHAGDGNIHVNILFDEASAEAAHRVAGEVMALTVRLGGTISGEHGVGLTKREYIGLEQDEPLLELQRRVKAVFDPKGILNPGKIFPSRGAHE